MTTRCLQKLDELDRVAEYVFRKHSRQRARSNVESRIESLRSKLQSYDEDIFRNDEGSPSQRSCKAGTPLSRTRPEGNSHVKFQNQSKHNKNKHSSARTTTPGKCATPIKQKPRSKSVPDCQHTKSKSKATDNHENTEHSLINERPVSTYGSHGNNLVYDTSVWFNLKPGRSHGVIDAFACDEKNERPLCYKIDPKTGECQPRLLKHRSAVRIGQNGVLRDVECMEEDSDKEVQEVPMLNEDQEKIYNEQRSGSTEEKADKKRTTPLSMEEQLKWEDARILTPRKQNLYQGKTKLPLIPSVVGPVNLCHQQPVFYNNRRSLNRTLAAPSVLERTHEPIYRFCQETHSVKNPDGTGPNRNITAVTLQDFSDLITTEIGEEKSKEVEKISHEKISKESLYKEKQRNRRSKTHVQRNNFGSGGQEQKEVVMFLEQGTQDIRVSFSEPNSQDKDSRTKTVQFSKTLGASMKNQLRPKSSDGKLHAPPKVQLFTENFQKKKSRPSTAPPSSPRLPHEIDKDICNYISSYFPSSLGMSKRFDFVAGKEDDGEDSRNHPTAIEEQNQKDIQYDSPNDTENGQEFFEKQSVKIMNQNNRVLSESQDLSQGQNNTLVQNDQQAAVNIHKDTRNGEIGENYLHNEEMNGGPPFEALSSLRHKIKKDLEKQTKELEQDIQQLYLKQNQDREFSTP